MDKLGATLGWRGGGGLGKSIQESGDKEAFPSTPPPPPPALAHPGKPSHPSRGDGAASRKHDHGTKEEITDTGSGLSRAGQGLCWDARRSAYRPPPRTGRAAPPVTSHGPARLGCSGATGQPLAHRTPRAPGSGWKSEVSHLPPLGRSPVGRGGTAGSPVAAPRHTADATVRRPRPRGSRSSQPAGRRHSRHPGSPPGFAGCRAASCRPGGRSAEAAFPNWLGRAGRTCHQTNENQEFGVGRAATTQSLWPVVRMR